MKGEYINLPRAKKEARAKMSEAERQAEVRVWRDQIPWTDEQIIEALLAHADQAPESQARDHRFWAGIVQKHGLTTRAYLRALPLLVKTCGICGRKALYRMGAIGRCSKHRDLRTAGVNHYLDLRDQKSGAIEQARKESDLILAMKRFKARRRPPCRTG